MSGRPYPVSDRTSTRSGTDGTPLEPGTPSARQVDEQERQQRPDRPLPLPEGNVACGWCGAAVPLDDGRGVVEQRVITSQAPASDPRPDQYVDLGLCSGCPERCSTDAARDTDLRRGRLWA